MELLKSKELFKCWKKDIFQVNIQNRLMEVKQTESNIDIDNVLTVFHLKTEGIHR